MRLFIEREQGQWRRTIQEFSGHRDTSTTLINTHIFSRGPLGIRSPMDKP